MKKILTGLFTAALIMSCNNTVTVENYDEKIDELYSKMSMEERLAQLQSRYMDDLFNENGELDTVCAMNSMIARH